MKVKDVLTLESLTTGEILADMETMVLITTQGKGARFGNWYEDKILNQNDAEVICFKFYPALFPDVEINRIEILVKELLS